VTWYAAGNFFVRGGAAAGEIDTAFDLPTGQVPRLEEGFGVVGAMGYEWLPAGDLHLWLQVDLWYLETMDNLTARGSTASLTVNYALW